MSVGVSRVVRALGVEQEDVRYTFHTLRHNFTTAMIAAGVQRDYVMQITGHRHHKSLERYIHVKDKAVLDSIDKVTL